VVVRLRPGFEVLTAATATYVGDRLGELEVAPDGIDVPMDPQGTVAVLLTSR
jgi:hypothetical protein